jgi:hypothetical protein
MIIPVSIVNVRYNFSIIWKENIVRTNNINKNALLLLCSKKLNILSKEKKNNSSNYMQLSTRVFGQFNTGFSSLCIVTSIAYYCSNGHKWNKSHCWMDTVILFKLITFFNIIAFVKLTLLVILLLYAKKKKTWYNDAKVKRRLYNDKTANTWWFDVKSRLHIKRTFH